MGTACWGSEGYSKPNLLVVESLSPPSDSYHQALPCSSAFPILEALRDLILATHVGRCHVDTGRLCCDEWAVGRS
ncbi:hypothetical protein SAMN04488056_104119 [Cohaesibacter marisflavi]|uniref:Uncharacterized protein n=1 Tax=Cohaesibacter marisflavi TaxID=655353 RepID=A0A1I5FP45_9HYPH|nr:hypothetical protein SAMN04488056_104119 [Cohaesibacter marisflavi]